MFIHSYSILSSTMLAASGGVEAYARIANQIQQLNDQASLDLDSACTAIITLAESLEELCVHASLQSRAQELWETIADLEASGVLTMRPDDFITALQGGTQEPSILPYPDESLEAAAWRLQVWSPGQPIRPRAAKGPADCVRQMYQLLQLEHGVAVSPFLQTLRSLQSSIDRDQYSKESLAGLDEMIEWLDTAQRSFSPLDHPQEWVSTFSIMAMLTAFGIFKTFPLPREERKKTPAAEAMGPVIEGDTT